MRSNLLLEECVKRRDRNEEEVEIGKQTETERVRKGEREFVQNKQNVCLKSII